MKDANITKLIIGGAMKVHSTLGPGFLESVYQSALAHELRKAALRICCEVPLQVEYDGIVVGEFVADMIVGGRILVENKAIQNTLPVHEVQVVNYLTATGLDIGLLLNFGGDRLQFKRKTRIYSPPGKGN